ncbi:hypothetical protein [Thermovibrio sp.]
MELAKIWGWWLVLICGVYLVRPSVCDMVLEMMERKEFVLISAWLSIFLGVPTLIFGSGIKELTALGILFTLNGLIRLAYPELMVKKAPLLRKYKQIPLSISALGLIYGLWLLVNYR